MIDLRPPSPRTTVALIVGAAVAFGLGMGAIVATSDHFSEAQGGDAVGVALIGWAFVGSGLVAAFRVAHKRFGALMVGVGFMWMATALEASDSSVVFTVGSLLSVVWIGLLFHALAAFPTGRIESRVMRAVVAVIYFDVLVLEFVYNLFWNPIDFGDCTDCPTNLLAFFSWETAADVMYIIQAPVIGSSAALVGAYILVRRWRTTSRAGRRALAPVLVTGAIAVSLLMTSVIIDGLTNLSENPVQGLTLLAIIAIPFAFLFGLLRGRLSRAVVSDLVLELGAAPGRPDELEHALGSALRDPSLSVAYWVHTSGSFVDGHGEPVELPARASGRAVRILERDGERVAALVHDAALADAPALLDSVAAAAGIALENERLRAELRAQLVEVRRSRARLVETADDERRRLERNLHDGAQQRLLGIGLALQLAQSRLNGSQPEVRELLGEADDELKAALEELRELARGIHPAILTDQGLSSALP
ncbi:MAG: sensor histidine kinase, partial [Gaiellaceae bacterium]